MKITKRQLRRAINEAMGMADHPDQVDDAQYDRGYQDGLDGYPPASDATVDYDAGYEDGIMDAELPSETLRSISERIGGGRRYSEIPAHPRGDLGKNIADVEFPIVVRYDGGSEIAYNQEDLDDILDDIAPSYGPGTGIKYSLDALQDLEVEDVPVGTKNEDDVTPVDKKFVILDTNC